VGDGNKFKNCRVEIELDNDTPTVVRMRSARLMFKARRTGDGKWEPVGWLNIDKKDVEQLERLNDVEHKGLMMRWEEARIGKKSIRLLTILE
jgi:hypothetical protein